MDERLNREGFDRLDSAEKETLMRELAERFRMSFLRLQTFSRWGNSITTGVFEKDGMEFTFVPGNTVTIGWDRFAVGMDGENQAELKELFEEYEYEGTIEDFLRQSMAPVHRAVIPPMLAGRRLREIGWEPVALDDPRLTCHEDWMAEFQRCKSEGISTLILHDCARFTRVDSTWQAALYHETDYPRLKKALKEQGYSLPTADEWAYLCGGGCRTLFPWGDGIDYAMHLRYFEERERDNRPYDMEEPNFFGLSIAYDPYKWEVVEEDRFTVCGGDGGCNACGGMGPLMSYLPCSPHCKPEVRDGGDLGDLDGNYDFFRCIIRLNTRRIQMNREELLKQIKEWNGKGEHKKIVDAIEALPREEWGYELTCLLARAYNNMKDAQQLEKAVSLFESVQEKGKDDPLWHYRLGFALYYLHRVEEALTCFHRALELNPDDSDTLQFIGWCEADQKTKVVTAERVVNPDRSDSKAINMDTDEVKQELKDLCRNAIHLNIGGKGASAVGGTRFGGVPDVPADFVWPTYEGTSYNDDEIKSRPLSFLAQFNCAELAPLDTEGLLPKTGVLSFFYEMESMRWGFDPKDAGCARVIYFEEVSALAPAQVPEDLADDFRFPMLKIAMESGPAFIDGQDFRILHEGEIDWEAMGDILNEFAIEDPENCSKLLGWPNLIQDSIMLECEFASHGYYLGNPEGWAKVPQNEREEKMQTSLEDWRLLFQLDTVESEEDNFELMFGDCGRLYFCIRKEDLLARRFDRMWLISQCY